MLQLTGLQGVRHDLATEQQQILKGQCSESFQVGVINSIEFNGNIGQPFPSPGDLPNPGIKPWSAALQADSLPLGQQGSLNIW